MAVGKKLSNVWAAKGLRGATLVRMVAPFTRGQVCERGKDWVQSTVAADERGYGLGLIRDKLLALYIITQSCSP
jgi:hypothetical protein